MSRLLLIAYHFDRIHRRTPWVRVPRICSWSRSLGKIHILPRCMSIIKPELANNYYATHRLGFRFLFTGLGLGMGCSSSRGKYGAG